MKALSFTARVYKVGINPCVDAPPEAGRIFERRGFIPIAGLVNGESYRATLVPRGGGRHRLYLNGEIMPMPAELAVKWLFSGLAQAVLLGIVTSLVYKPEPSSAP
jgi:hypothetical protein